MSYGFTLGVIAVVSFIGGYTHHWGLVLLCMTAGVCLGVIDHLTK